MSRYALTQANAASRTAADPGSMRHGITEGSTLAHTCPRQKMKDFRTFTHKHTSPQPGAFVSVDIIFAPFNKINISIFHFFFFSFLSILYFYIMTGARFIADPFICNNPSTSQPNQSSLLRGTTSSALWSGRASSNSIYSDNTLFFSSVFPPPETRARGSANAKQSRQTSGRSADPMSGTSMDGR